MRSARSLAEVLPQISAHTPANDDEVFCISEVKVVSSCRTNHRPSPENTHIARGEVIRFSRTLSTPEDGVNMRDACTESI